MNRARKLIEPNHPFMTWLYVIFQTNCFNLHSRIYATHLHGIYSDMSLYISNMKSISIWSSQSSQSLQLNFYWIDSSFNPHHKSFFFFDKWEIKNFIDVIQLQTIEWFNLNSELWLIYATQTSRFDGIS